MNIYDLNKFRNQLLSDITQGNSIKENDIIDYSLDILLDSKLIDNKSNNEAYINSYVESTSSKSFYKLNSYNWSETGERLQLFVVDEQGLFSSSENSLQSTQEYYNSLFKLTENFIQFAFKRRLQNIPDIGTINTLVNFMGSYEGVETIDTIDIFLISPSITYQKAGAGENLKDFDFKDITIPLKYSKKSETRLNQYDEFKKDINIYRHLININYLYKNFLATGNKSDLNIDFKDLGFPKIKANEAVKEDKFESYIAVFPATLLTELYKKYSFRLLEKNVRSFLQFKKDGPNSGMKKTLKEEPEKFIAYNNGLTVTSTAMEIDSDGYLSTLSDFQIVNGGQTTASIYFSKKEGIDISKAFVTAKINIAKNSSEDELNELITNIGIYSNAQTKVTSVDLRSRNPQLGKIKQLSESILTPTSKKWFFEKSRGELTTLLLMSSNKNTVERQNPKERRISKEQLGKYYSSWGNQPHLIKKGGESVFRTFIEEINNIEISRDFYEDMIGRVILFKQLEDIHGIGNNALSQIRSAIIPYTISIIYEYTDNSKNDDFNFFKIWRDEKISEKAKQYFKSLMKLVLELIKENRTSDDLSENSKKEELWIKVFKSPILKAFMEKDDTKKILKEYGISKAEKKKLLTKKKRVEPINFENISNTAILFDKGISFFKEILRNFEHILTPSNVSRINKIMESISSIGTLNPIILDERTVAGFFEIQNKIANNDSEKFDIILSKYKNDKYIKCVNWFIERVNDSEYKNADYYNYFKYYADLAATKKFKFSSTFKEVSDNLEKGISPNVRQIHLLLDFIETLIK